MEFTCGEWGRQEYGYDARGRLLSVSEGGQEVELYAYDAAGNVLRKTVRGRTTTFAYDGANQLVSSECGDARTEYAYDAAGRLVREGNRTYRYGYLDKVLQVSEGDKTFTYAYHPDGQLARADYGDGTAEDFLWDGLALVRRGGESILNEPHPGGGSPVLASSGTAYFSDILGTTLGEREKGRKYAAARQTAFGEGNAEYFTGKPAVAGLGRAFLFRNYRPDLARWQTADPLGYPDGWNRLAYGPNSPLTGVDIEGARWVTKTFWYADEYTDFVVLPGGLPLDMPGISPNVWQEVFNYFAGSGAAIITNFALEIMKPLWDRYKAEINARDATIAEAEAERVGRKGFEDYEVYSVGYFSASSDAEYIAEAIQIHHMSVTWEVVCRKWEE